MEIQRFRKVRVASSAILFAALAVGCQTPRVEPFPATRVQPAQGETLAVDNLVLLFDASGSIGSGEGFATTRALLESFAAGLPDGRYRTALIAFGGDRRESLPLAGFDRSALGTSARELRFLGEHSPLGEVLGEAAAVLEGRSGDSAVVLFSDGLPNRFGRPQSPEATLEAARALMAQQDGRVCFHSVRTGDETGGADLLVALAELSGCGSTRPLAAVSRPDGLYAFQREVMVGQAAPPPVAAVPPAAPRDTDGDGVGDSGDACAGTPAGASVDERGCWVLSGLLFGSDSADLDEASLTVLEEVARVLDRNPALRVRVDGHTDATGPAAYNEALSLRRARSVEARLVALGVPADRIEARGLGESQPVAPNDTAQGRRDNRRIELSVLR